MIKDIYNHEIIIIIQSTCKPIKNHYIQQANHQDPMYIHRNPNGLRREKDKQKRYN